MTGSNGVTVLICNFFLNCFNLQCRFESVCFITTSLVSNINFYLFLLLIN